jgi:RNA polymerase sigma-70 factor, ECF subfamily
MKTKTGSGNSRDTFAVESVRFIDALYRNALELVKNREDAEDLVQETFAKAFRYYETFQTGTNLKAWLMKIQFNTFVYRYRRSTLERHVLNRIATETTVSDIVGHDASRALKDAEGVALWPIVKDEIDNALNEMPEDYRLAITLADIEGLKYKEIAEVLGLPIGTVMSRIYRARNVLRTRILNRPDGRGAIDQKSWSAA